MRARGICQPAIRTAEACLLLGVTDHGRFGYSTHGSVVAEIAIEQPSQPRLGVQYVNVC